MKQILHLTSFLSVCLLGVLTSYGQQMPFQGRLMQNNLPVNDTLDISFAVTAVSWSETHAGVVVTDGLYSLVLGSVSPLPENLFDGVEEQSLEIAINGSSLSPVKLYPAMATARTRYEKVLGEAVVNDTARYTRISGGGTAERNVASYIESATNAGNVAQYGHSISQSGSTQAQFGLYGNASGDGVGTHIGSYGRAGGSASKFNIGLYGAGTGPGNGDSGLANGSYNTGVSAYAGGNSWGNTGVFGRVSGENGVDNIGVVGWSEISTGSDTTLNSGVLGWAKGTGINRGVVGMASGGAQNWAGWFEGNVKMEGSILSSGSILTANATDSVLILANGDIYASGTVTATTLTQSSDRRFKENIRPLQSSLKNVSRLEGVSYDWKDKNKGHARQIGLIAQEVEAIYPEFVHTNEEGYKSVNYAGMVAVLIEAVKELENKVSTLEQDKESLGSENASLKAELESGMKALHERMGQLEKMLGQQPLQASKQFSATQTEGK